MSSSNPSESAISAQASSHPQNTSSSRSSERGNPSEDRRSHSNNFSRGKHSRGRGGRQGKARDLGRSDWSKQKGDKRQRNEDEQAAKRQRVDRGDAALPVYATKFAEDELKAEERKPKKKVAVLIGYAGTGYRGMQLAHDQKTIEGDLFQAFVRAGAISKNNADDPKKSSFVRCARTDKGVHAAGNVISLKLIVEDEDIVKKINDNLVPQIRVWGFERTNNSFSAYQLVDSRIYEYLIPSHSFLPPHPRSFMGMKCESWAKKKNDYEAWKSRQEEVEGYWEKVDEEVIKPILEEYDEHTKSVLEKALFLENQEQGDGAAAPSKEVSKDAKGSDTAHPDTNSTSETPNEKDTTTEYKPTRSPAISEGTKRLRQAYLQAKRAYRIPEKRLARVRDTLKLFVGTRNYHNFTVQKTFKDPSSKRVIKSFVVNPEPILINGTEWLSLKVHGQSFMMHQIRKMVGMVALIVRSGCDPQRLVESFGSDLISIPKAPSLGLLLERPVFDSYNKRAKGDFGRDALDFDKYKSEMDDFKQREIYERMYRDEEQDNVFGNFFNHVDAYPESTFLYVTSGGIEATKEKTEGGPNVKTSGQAGAEVDDESDDDNGPENDKLGDEG
ncbi:tRNA pseudouridine(38-40) synthase [Cyphellophora europaea CBS 101466]|uniref:tRNA pseudouridine synthase 1 n=1 Tax=Cyphellophora europaea (strain CBS 101466) TaxID=1220924 RepID=W2RSB8_CYPE1|nr:tRNA pseudouridine(38-40) synthase [Cyphellophora europaea CBS 101466]ETN39210.1 tRNA pseudouridine(38-40) synthase [Cyphellophora europaea CBS 101466]